MTQSEQETPAHAPPSYDELMTEEHTRLLHNLQVTRAEHTARTTNPYPLASYVMDRSSPVRVTIRRHDSDVVSISDVHLASQGLSSELGGRVAAIANPPHLSHSNPHHQHHNISILNNNNNNNNSINNSINNSVASPVASSNAPAIINGQQRASQPGFSDSLLSCTAEPGVCLCACLCTPFRWALTNVRSEVRPFGNALTIYAAPWFILWGFVAAFYLGFRNRLILVAFAVLHSLIVYLGYTFRARIR